MIWSVLTELSRGMEKIIRRNVWGALKRSGPRDWPMGEKPAERRANFFLMNSTACSTMQSDCQDWTHIWTVFGGSEWQDRFCLQRKGGVGVGRRWLLLASPVLFFFFPPHFIRVRCCSGVQEMQQMLQWSSEVPVEKNPIRTPSDLFFYCFPQVNVARAKLVLSMATLLYYSA